MGIAVGAPGSSGAGDLLQEAEIALVSAKRHPSHRIAMFDPLSSRHALERLDVEAELWTALERDELIVHYQPILDLRTRADRRLRGARPLAAPVAGSSCRSTSSRSPRRPGLIVAIGRRSSRRRAGRPELWRERWPDENLVMSVNLSPRQFLDPGPRASHRQVLEGTGLDPSALELEITETSVMDRSESSLRALADLRTLGVRVVLDDFGTGYSSLAYLRQLPLDTIKIDRSFVTDLDVHDRNVGIVRAVVSLAHGLGITVVAEGIETDEQARRLRELGCDMGQGYAWSRPLDPRRIETLLPTGPGQRLLPNSRGRDRKRLAKAR